VVALIVVLLLGGLMAMMRAGVAAIEWSASA